MNCIDSRSTARGAGITRVAGSAGAWVAVCLGWHLAAAATAAPAAAPATVAPAEAHAIAAGKYRVVLESPGGDLPFELDLVQPAHPGQAGSRWVGYLVNGKERVELTDVTVQGSHLTIGMPGYENRLTAAAVAGGLEGELVLDKLGGKDQHIPLHARVAEPYRFFPASAGKPAADKPAQVAGRWSVTFSEDGGASEAAVGEFKQSGDQVGGTFLTATGDHRFLAGQVRGDELYLSTFDGAHVFLYKARLGQDGSLAGDFWSGNAYHERWAAKRDPNATLPDPYSVTTLRSGARALDFSFPDLDGKQISSKDARFRGKVLIVALAGSWCPNCHDEAAFLAPLYRDYRSKGLEIVSLMFEHFGDFEHAAAATERFRRHYGIEYTTLIAGISDKDDAAKKLPTLERVYAFPTTVFIDRQGLVRKIHTGYSGPATGAHYTDFVAEFKRTLDQLLAES